MRVLRVLLPDDPADRWLVERTDAALGDGGHVVRHFEAEATPRPLAGIAIGPAPRRALLAGAGDFDVVEVPQEAVIGLHDNRDGVDIPPVVVRAPRLAERAWERMNAPGAPGRPGVLERFRFPRSAIEPWRAGMRGAAAVLCADPDDARYLVETVGLAEDRVLPFHAGVDRDGFAGGEHAPPTGAIPRLLWLGGFAPSRGCATVVSAFARLREEMPQLHLAIADPAGDGETIRGAFPESVRAGVEVLPAATEAQRRAACASHDILLATAPADGYDPYVPEAAAAGLALILGEPASRALGWNPGSDHERVRGDDPAAVAAMVRQLVHDPDRRARLRFAAVAAARSRTWEAAAQEFVAGYVRATTPR